MSIYEKELRADFESYLRGEEPHVFALTTAPVIDEWEAVVDLELGASTRRCMLLRGIVTGHPLLANGSEITTSPVAWIDRDMKWARTRNTIYRLGGRKIPLDGADQ